jgi:hypothetical protein
MNREGVTLFNEEPAPTDTGDGTDTDTGDGTDTDVE